MNINNYLIVYSTLFGTVLGSLVTILVQNFINNKNLQKERDYEIKVKIYTRLSKILQDYLSEGPHKTEILRYDLNTILAEAYIIAPDQVILGLRRIFIDEIQDGKILGSSVTNLVQSLRKELIPHTEIKASDLFYLPDYEK